MKILSLLAGLMVIFALAACDSTAATPTPSGPAPVQETPAGNDTNAASPTVETNAANPTDTPASGQTGVDTEPTATRSVSGLSTKITEPVFVFMPRQGGPGAIVNITGGNFTPGMMVAIRIGLPDPVGEPLGSVKVGEDGMWNTSVTMPGTLPSGEAIKATELKILAMDENNQVIVSRPFKFTPAP